MPSPARIIWKFNGQQFVKEAEPIASPVRPNYVICCKDGDWSGFRTLKGCEDQFDELIHTATKNGFESGHYWVEER